MTSSIFALLLVTVLIVDLVVWFSTKKLLKSRSEQGNTGFVETVMSILGSWSALAIMGIASVGWAIWNFYSKQGDETLDVVISVWTMLLDVLVIIGANYTRERDRELLQEIYDKLVKQQ